MRKFLLMLFLILITLPVFGWQKNVFGGKVLIKEKKGFVLPAGLLSKRLILAYHTPVKIKGLLNNSIISIGDSVIVTGQVNKNIILLNSSLRVAYQAQVKGTILSLGGRVVLEKGSAAKCIQLGVLLKTLQFSLGLRIFFMYLSFVLLGVFFNFYFMKNFVFIGEYLKVRFADALLIGVFVLPLALLLALLFAGTLIGLFFLPALVFIFIFYFFFSFYTIAMLVGERIMKLFTFRDHPYFEEFLGISLFFFIALLPVIGIPLFIFLLLAGLGAVLRLKFGVR